VDVGEGAAAGVVIALCVSGQRSSARVWKLVRVFAGEPLSGPLRLNYTGLASYSAHARVNHLAPRPQSPWVFLFSDYSKDGDFLRCYTVYGLCG